MPIGCYNVVPFIANHFERDRPLSVLDLGCGMGFYGAVVRQWADRGIYPFSTRLVGVEGFDAYENPCWNLYDDVLKITIQDFLYTNTEKWDSILLLDVIEHFEKDEGIEILDAIKDRLASFCPLFVATPAIWIEQGATYGNELERHRSLWTVDDFDQMYFDILIDGSKDEHGNQMILAQYQD